MPPKAKATGDGPVEPQLALRCLECGKVLLPGTPLQVVTCGCPNGARVAGGGPEHLSWNARDRSRCEVIQYTGEPT